MRNIYVNKPKLVRPLTQGSIFSNGVATKYKSTVFGLIISARCDLAHEGKVEYVYYLPIVDLKEWYEVDGKLYLLNKDICNVQNKLMELCTLHHIPFQKMKKDQLIKMSEIIDDAQTRKSFVDQVDKYFDLLCTDVNIYNPSKKNVDALVNNLFENKYLDYLLIECWEDPSLLKVILLRDLKRVEYKIAMDFSRGIEENDIISKNSNDLAYSETNSNFYTIKTEVSSPYIEYILQRFAQNFSRIGLEDMSEENRNRMKSIINQ